MLGLKRSHYAPEKDVTSLIITNLGHCKLNSSYLTIALFFVYLGQQIVFSVINSALSKQNTGLSNFCYFHAWMLIAIKIITIKMNFPSFGVI